MSTKVASGKTTAPKAKLLDEFNASIMFDKELYLQDIEGSIAHVKMLSKQEIISNEAKEKIIDGLHVVQQEIEEGQYNFDISDEDIHMSIESRLSTLIGDDAKRMHTARSRNDQVALDFRMYVLKSNKELVELLFDLQRVLLDISAKHTKTLLPGMTHLQHAQPINFAYHMLAYVSMFKRDIERFEDSYKRNNISPIGCAALAGSPYQTDREYEAKLLGFDSVSINCLDTVSDRDFALEILFNISTLMMHISRLSEEIILWSSSEFGFVELSDEYSTSSSIMPQKKNPDVPELLRGKTGRVNGNLISLLTVLKGLPLAYNKDMQEDKEGVFDSVKTAKISVKILSEALKSMRINKEEMLKATKKGHLSATDLADYLTANCEYTFRDAYKLTGEVVAYAEENKKDISELNLDELKKFELKIQEDIINTLELETSMNARKSQGGTATCSTLKQLEYFESWMKIR
ncbi:argininosuccinate lyase [Sulfurospirillum arcachonense]|uniref:argininosuccinate lyase n=1 Tax=Sulfurospirillum arcachonense TaxID=57666 RepID=UPI00046838A2|nr:argininosuccinate lyase [Sulfurospirillum arcachonense]